MSRHAAPPGEESRNADAPRRCLSCNGIIDGLADQDLGIGLNIRLGLVSDECALICNECTAKLIEMRPAGGKVSRGADKVATEAVRQEKGQLVKQEQAEPSDRRIALVEAEKRAETLFDEIEKRNLIRPGRTEREIEQEIYTIALEQFGVEKHWHKRIVRAGENTLTLAADNPPIRNIGDDDIVYVDLGPVFEDWEADLGRTYVLGSHPGGPLVEALPIVFDRVQAHYHASPEITGEDLYAFAEKASEEAGWRFGGVIAGHLVSEFAHAHIPGDKNLNRIMPGNDKRMRDPDELGRERHWILEIHLVEPNGAYGGFYERLL